MKIISDIKEWKKIKDNLSPDLKIGLIPTMGCLHQGHASLIKNSVLQNDITVLSIFVNPTQFNDPSDYQHYPKTLDSDIELACQLNVDYVITPDIDSMYPDGNQIHLVTDHPLSGVMEGHYRPGHFNGVLTIVMKLLILIRANKIYFGEKDYQQYFLVNELVKKYFVQTEVMLCPTVRESSGLPFSSRNMKLSTNERQLIETFYEFFYIHYPHSLTDIKEKISELGMQHDYFETYNDRLFFALKIGSIRIIDNFKEASLYVN